METDRTLHVTGAFLTRGEAPRRFAPHGATLRPREAYRDTSQCGREAQRSSAERNDDLRLAAARMLLHDLNDQNATPIRIHFIQFESRGHPGRDPRQVEVTCLSGGRFRYRSSNDFPRNRLHSLNTAMTDALNNVRLSLSGHWQLASQVSSWVDSRPSGTRPGSLRALSGNFIIRSSASLRTTDVESPFGIGRSRNPHVPAHWDRRPTARKACTTATDCGANGDSDPCAII